MELCGTLAGVSQALLTVGSADIATTMIYVHHVPQVDAAERLSRALAGDRSAEALSAEAP